MYKITSFETTIPEDLFHIKGLKLWKIYLKHIRMSIVHYVYISKTKNRDIESILDEPK